MSVSSQLVVTILVWCLTGIIQRNKGGLSQQACYENVNKCFYLYEETQAIKAEEAFQKCTSFDQTLATIEDEAAQDVISKLGNINNAAAWLAGKISNNDEWQTLDGKQISDFNYEPGTDFRCSSYKPTSDKPIISAVPCQIPPTPSTFLRLSVCQTSPTQDGCPKLTTRLNGRCYAVPPNGTFTAFDGNTVCTTTVPGSTLAYSGINEQGFQTIVRDGISATLRNDEAKIEVWIGVFRKPWVWLQGALSGSETPMMYTHWQATYGAQTNGSCLTVVLNNGKTWQNIDCNFPLKWYICEGTRLTSDTAKSSTTTTTTTTTTTMETTTTTIPGAKVATDPGFQAKSYVLMNKNTTIIIATVTTILVLIILIASILICWRYWYKRKTDENSDDREISEFYFRSSEFSGSSVRESELTPSTIVDATNRDQRPASSDNLSKIKQNNANRVLEEFVWGQND